MCAKSVASSILQRSSRVEVLFGDFWLQKVGYLATALIKLLKVKIFLRRILKVEFQVDSFPKTLKTLLTFDGFEDD